MAASSALARAILPAPVALRPVPMTMPARVAMIAMTASNSSKVNPCRWLERARLALMQLPRGARTSYSSSDFNAEITEKSSSVVVSPLISPLVASSLSRRRMIFPERVLGKPAAKRT